MAPPIKTVPDEMIDILPPIRDHVNWCGVRYPINIHQSKSCIDAIDKSNWGMVLEAGEPQIFKEPGSSQPIQDSVASLLLTAGAKE